VRNKDIVGVLSRTGAYGDESAGLKDLVKCCTIHYEVLDYRESGTSPWLYRDGSAVFEVTHEKLASGHMVIRTMCTTVNIEGACTADTFATIMVEGYRAAALATFLYSYRIITFPDKLLIEDIKHLKERGILFNTRDMISLKMSLGFGVFLTPYL
jgi:hypothetical protein